jgi:hypothetical protein
MTGKRRNCKERRPSIGLLLKEQKRRESVARLLLWWMVVLKRTGMIGIFQQMLERQLEHLKNI